MPRVPSTSAGPGALLLGVLGGFAVGFLGCFLQAVRLLGLPVGTAGVLAATGLVFLGAGYAARSRAIAAACAAGWALAVLLALTPRAAGDLVLTAQPATYVFMAGGLVLGAVAASWPYGTARGSG